MLHHSCAELCGRCLLHCRCLPHGYRVCWSYIENGSCHTLPNAFASRGRRGKLIDNWPPVSYWLIWRMDGESDMQRSLFLLTMNSKRNRIFEMEMEIVSTYWAFFGHPPSKQNQKNLFELNAALSLSSSNFFLQSLFLSYTIFVLLRNVWMFLRYLSCIELTHNAVRGLAALITVNLVMIDSYQCSILPT